MTPQQAANLAAELTTQADSLRLAAAELVAALRTTEQHALAGAALEGTRFAVAAIHRLAAFALRAAD